MFYINNILLAIVLIVLFTPVKVKAQGSGIPTFDAAGFIQTVEELARMQELIEKAEQEITALDNQYQAMTGSRGMGDLLNDISQQNIRRYSPKNWQDNLKILKAGGNPGSLSDLKKLYVDKRNLFSHIKNKYIYPDNPDNENIASFGHARDTTLGSMALSETSFNRNDIRISNYENLIDQIDLATDTKASADLANRIAIENGLTSSELIRLQATQIQLNAAQANQNIKYESDIYRFSSGQQNLNLEPIQP